VKRPRRQSGFALPMALVIIAIASLLAVTCVTMVLSAGRIATGDARARQAYEVALAGLSDACERLRWAWPLATVGDRTTLDDDRTYETQVTPLLVPADARPHLLVKSVGHIGSAASKAITAEVVLESDSLPAGLTVAGDVEACAPVSIIGSGLYANGDVSGRQLITFAAAGGQNSLQPPADWAQAERFSAAAVHASGEIRDDVGEEHDPSRVPETQPADTDTHTPLAARPLQWELDGLTLTTLSAHALAADRVLRDGVLDVGRLPLQPSFDDVESPGNGILVVVSADGSDQGLRLVGSRPAPPIACPLTVVIVGDATITTVGQSASPVTWWGSLIVTGGLVIASPTVLHGSLFARHLTVVAPLSLELEHSWWRDPPPGYLRALIVARDW
jgi:hypothetical protein